MEHSIWCPEEELHTPIEESVLMDFKVGEHQKELKSQASPKPRKPSTYAWSSFVLEWAPPSSILTVNTMSIMAEKKKNKG